MLFFLWVVHKDEDVDLVYCKTENRNVDLFIKSLPASKFEFIRPNILEFVVP